MNVVFMDNDIFVFKSLARIFENEDFDYGCTISDSKAMPARLRSPPCPRCVHYTDCLACCAAVCRCAALHVTTP